MTAIPEESSSKDTVGRIYTEEETALLILWEEVETTATFLNIETNEALMVLILGRIDSVSRGISAFGRSGIGGLLGGLFGGKQSE